MAFILKRRLYEALPLWLQSSVRAVPFSWLAGSAYRCTLRRGPFFDGATREEILRYQEDALGRMLRFAAEQVPAYAAMRSVVDRHAAFEALKGFPPIDKDAVQKDLDRHLPRSLKSIPHYEARTGGTSGNQLRIALEDSSQAVEHAFCHRLWSRVGYTPRQRKATFRGVSFGRLTPGTYWKHNPINNELQFSPFHMNGSTLPAYLDAFVEYGAPYIHGYPSAIDMLARHIERTEAQERLPRIRAIFLASEMCYPDQRERMERVFQSRVFSFYGHTERLVMAGECERSEVYHSFPDYGITEILDEEGNPRAEGERGEIVGTGFLNRAMPLIRYRTGDSACSEPASCPCGRRWDRFSQVAGRWKQEMIVGRCGSRISLTALNMHGSIFDRVIRCQYFQERPGECELRVMAGPDFSDDDRKRIVEAFIAKVGREIDLSVVVVPDIPLTERGKLPLLISRIPADQR